MEISTLCALAAVREVGRARRTLVHVFRRNQTTEATEPAPAVDQSVTAQGKGRPTPSRKEAEAARRQRVKPALTRKEAAAQRRAATRADRERVKVAMDTGDERGYMPRDRGPVRAFIRDFVDSRRSVAEYFLPLMLVVLVLGWIPNPQIVMASTTLMLMILIFGVADLIFLSRRLKRQVRDRFPDDNSRGNTFYGISRATMIRRMRLPKARVKPGAVI